MSNTQELAEAAAKSAINGFVSIKAVLTEMPDTVRKHEACLLFHKLRSKFWQAWPSDWPIPAGLGDDQ